MSTNPIIPGDICSRRGRWIKFCAAVVGLALFIYIVIPWISGLPMAEQLVKSNRDNAIDATGLFYSETSEFGESENYIRNSAHP